MVVKLKHVTAASKHKKLTPGNQYRVIAFSPNSYRIMSDDGEPTLFDKTLFDVISDFIPEYWVFKLIERSDKTVIYAGPQVFSEPGFRETTLTATNKRSKPSGFNWNDGMGARTMYQMNAPPKIRRRKFMRRTKKRSLWYQKVGIKRISSGNAF